MVLAAAQVTAGICCGCCNGAEPDSAVVVLST